VKTIKNLKQLAGHVGAAHDTGTVDEVSKSIAHRLYKDTSSGISFYVPKGGKTVVVSGYCEGTDAECVSRELRFPFTDQEFDEQVAAADEDANVLWDETHGCEECGGEHVDPDCPKCGGDGIII
jgi:hypothetical protein